MLWDKRKLSTYHKIVRVIAALMVLATAEGIVIILPMRGTNIDPVVKWIILLILALMFCLSALMFWSPSRDP
jgi:hypothetical protein